MNKNIIVIFMLLMVITFTGCSRVLTPDELISPPELDIEKKEVKDAVTKFLPQNSEMFTFPYAKENRENSLYYEDITGDGVEDIIAIYRDKSTFKVGILMLTNELGVWVKKTDIMLDGDDITDYRIVDMDLDGEHEVILGYESRSTSVRKLDIFSASRQGLETVFESEYYTLSIDDILDNGQNQLIITSVSGENTDNRVAVFSVENKLISMKNSMRYQNGTEPYNLTVGEVVEGKKAIFVDLYVNNSYGKSDVLIYEDAALVSLIGRTEDEVGTYQQTPIQSRDVDNDGIIEIGSTSAAPMMSTNEEGYEIRVTDALPLRNYYKYKDGSFTKVKEYFDEATLGIVFDVPEVMWNSYYTALSYENNNSILSFYLKSDGLYHTEESYKFLEFRLAPKEEKESFEGYQVIYETNNYVIVGKHIDSQVVDRTNSSNYRQIIEATKSFSTLISQFAFN